MQNTKFDGGILVEIEAHLAPLGWCYEDLYENLDLINDLSAEMSGYQVYETWHASDECHTGFKYYEEEQNRIHLLQNILWGKNIDKSREKKLIYNTERRCKSALNKLNAIKKRRSDLNKRISELRVVISALKDANRHQSRLPSCYSEEALLP